MHDTAYEWVASQVADLTPGASVLEIGSQNVNGSVRPLFASAARYIGVDIVPGPGVDFVIQSPKELNTRTYGRFDVVICTNVLEHVEDWQPILQAALRVLRPGGVFLLQAAGPGFDVHSGRSESLNLEPDEWYNNVHPYVLRYEMYKAGWTNCIIECRADWPFDIYCRAVKPLAASRKRSSRPSGGRTSP